MSLLDYAYIPAIQVTPGDSVSAALRAVRPTNGDAVTVVDPSGIAGILTSQDVLRQVIMKDLNPANTAVQDVMTSPAQTLVPDTSVQEALDIMIQGNFRHIPLSEDGRVVQGMLSLRKMVHLIVGENLEYLTESEAYLSLLDVSHAPAQIVKPLDTVKQAVAAMLPGNCDAVVVKIKDSMVGILTVHDVLWKVILEDQDPKETLVGEIMTSPVMTLLSKATPEEALNLMMKWNFRHVPVSGNWATVEGIISLRSLLVHVVRHQKKYSLPANGESLTSNG